MEQFNLSGGLGMSDIRDLVLFILTGMDADEVRAKREPQPRPADDTDAWRGFEPTE